MADTTLLYILGGIGYLIAGALYFEWRLRHLWRTLPQRAFASISEALFVTEEITGGAPRTRLAVPFRAIAGHLADELTPLFIERALKTVKLKLPAGAPSPLIPGQPLDLNVVLGMLPKRYQGWAALLAPMLEKFIPGLSSAPSAPAGGGKEGVNPFLKELEPGA